MDAGRGDEGDVPASLAHEAHQVEEALGTRVPVQLGHGVGRDEGAARHHLSARLASCCRRLAVEFCGPLVLARERLLPALGKQRSVQCLEALGSLRQIGPGGRSLDVDDDALGFVEDDASERTNAETEVGVLIEAESVRRVESARLEEEIATEGEQAARAVVDLARHREEREVRIRVAVTELRRRAVAEDEASRLLEPAVRVDEPAADGADVVPSPERSQKWRQPTRERDRVVVEQDDELAAGLLDGAVDGREEARVHLVPEQAHVWIGFRQLLQVRDRAGAGGVVDDQDLAAEPGGDGLLECMDARLRVRELFMTRDDDRDGRRVLEEGGRSGEARRRAIVRHLEHRLPRDARRLGEPLFGGRDDARRRRRFRRGGGVLARRT